MENNLTQAFKGVFETDLLSEIEKHGKLIQFSEGDIIIDIGQRVTQMPLLIEGVIKILREDENGDELLLYYLERGDTCAMSMNCCMGSSKSEIRATAETEGKLLLIPIEKMELWLGQFGSWRRFVFDNYNIRLHEMLEAIDNLAFMNLEERILKHIADKAEVTQSLELKSTHNEIAAELHTSRVVVSRLLKALEKKGKIKLFRNRIEVKKS
ncbi:MAG: Crp/Fnr family transcriptional regulator [Flavobacteriales bacterium CG_4_9_14_3_um_filter_40_17]|nr:MAG: Crp/Fnr family transcriptional regulator [Flavobacteriales bacterium CG_4_9_14_3_um_filter_40_17]